MAGGADALVVALITALTLVYFYPLFLGRTNSILGPYGSYVYPWASVPNTYGLTEPQTDYAELSYPWLVITDDALDEGTIPLWASNVYGGGYDLFANGSSAVIYPPRLFFLAITSPVRAHDLFLVFHLWGSGIAMYLLARELSIGRWGASFAAVAWMFATWNTGWMQLEVVTPMALFLPATIAAVHRAMTRRTGRATIGAGLVCALAASSGHLLLLGVTLFVAASYAAALAVTTLWHRRGGARSADVADVDLTAERDLAAGDAPSPGESTSIRPEDDTPKHLRRSRKLELLGVGGRLALLGLVAAGSAAMLLVPTLLALRNGQRVPFSYAELRDNFLAEPWMLKRLVLPQQVPIDADDMQYLGFVGTATAVFAVVGLFSRRRPGAWLARVLVVAVPLVMIGTPLTWVVWRFVPAMDVFRPYTRLIVFASFGMVIAAGIGVQLIVEAARRHRPRSDVVLAVALVMVIVATAGQLMWLGRRSNPPFVPHEARYALPNTPLIDSIDDDADPDGWPARVIPLVLRRADDGELTGVTLYANTGAAVGVDTTSGYDSSVDPRTMTMLRVLGGADPADPTLGTLPSAYLATFESWSTRFELLARLGVTDIVTLPPPADTAVNFDASWDRLDAVADYSGADGTIYAVPGAVAGPRLVAADEVVADERQALSRFADPAFPAERVVLVEADELSRSGIEPLGAPSASSGSGAATTRAEDLGEIVSAQRGVNTARIEVSAEAPAWVVVPDAWAEGWRATVNGKSAPVVRVNYYQRAVRVDAGTSTIAMRYRPPGLVAGTIVSIVTVTASLLALVWLSVAAWSDARRSARRRLEFEHQLVAEQPGGDGHAGLVDPGDEPPTGAGRT